MQNTRPRFLSVQREYEKGGINRSESSSEKIKLVSNATDPTEWNAGVVQILKHVNYMCTFSWQKR
jgi:hypothetical protein